MMKITIVGGTGYVGLTTAVGLASKGHLVFCVGRTREKVEKISRGIPIIYEDRLDELLKSVLKKEKLIPTTDLTRSVQKSDVSFICVGTPSRQDGSIDLTQVEEVAKKIGNALTGRKEYCVITVKSTVIPGTTEKLVLPALESFSKKRAGKDFGVCMTPEFLREGHAVKDFLFPKDQGIVIGEFDRKSGDVLCEIYEDFGAKILRTDIRAAEMIKYARNSYLAKDVSFANEISNICQELGVDYLDVKTGMELDSRIGTGRFLSAGVGFGGSCFPKDVNALVAKAKEIGTKPRMLEATLEVNETQPAKLIELTKQVIGQLRGKKIGVLGLAFKPGTDDMREAPAIKVINGFLLEEAEVFAYDPKALDNARRIFGNKIVYVSNAEQAIASADACVIVTEWPEFADPRLYSKMRSKIIIDGRRVLDPALLPADFTYHAIGFPGSIET
jgi:UDPglucose 6-dehydrogenase